MELWESWVAECYNSWPKLKRWSKNDLLVIIWRCKWDASHRNMSVCCPLYNFLYCGIDRWVRFSPYEINCPCKSCNSKYLSRCRPRWSQFFPYRHVTNEKFEARGMGPGFMQVLWKIRTRVYKLKSTILFLFTLFILLASVTIWHVELLSDPGHTL